MQQLSLDDEMSSSTPGGSNGGGREGRRATQLPGWLRRDFLEVQAGPGRQTVRPLAASSPPAPSLIGGVVFSPPRRAGGRGKKSRSDIQSTPVSAGRRDASSYFLEEKEKAAGDDSGEMDEELLQIGAASVTGSLAAAVQVLKDTFEEDVRVQGESQDCLQRVGAFLSEQGLQVSAGDEAWRERQEATSVEEEVGAGPELQEEQGQEVGQGLGLAAARTVQEPGQVEQEEVQEQGEQDILPSLEDSEDKDSGDKEDSDDEDCSDNGEELEQDTSLEIPAPGVEEDKEGEEEPPILVDPPRFQISQKLHGRFR